jgi:NTE family protein
MGTQTTSRIGLALGSGSARGLAHIGVLRAVQEAGLSVDLYAGTSMGALVGALAASGRVDDLEKAFLALNWKQTLSLLDPVFPRSGLIDGHKVGEFLQSMLPIEKFEQLVTPFQAVSTDIMTGEEVVLASGNLIEAVRASIAVPGIFTPVRRRGRILADGGLVNPVPVSTVKKMGATCVIAVDLNHDIVTKRLQERLAPVSVPDNNTPSPYTRVLDSLKSSNNEVMRQLGTWLTTDAPKEVAQPPLPSIFDMLLASVYISQTQVTKTNLQQHRPDILIQPPLGDIRFMEFDRAEEIIEIGYSSAKAALAPHIDRLLAAA